MRNFARGGQFWPLDLDLVNRKEREEDCGGDRFHAPIFIGDTYHKYLNDTEGDVFVSGCGELRPPYIGCGGEAARGRVVHFGVHCSDGRPLVAVIERDEPLRLFLSVTDEARADFNLLSMCWNA